ncbi:MAG: NAD-glutamate dehydrogenase [Solirubrobacteraceae bacterium]
MKARELEAELIDTVLARVHERQPLEHADACAAFVRQYYDWVPTEDLIDRGPLDLYGAAVAHWNLAQQRLPGEAKIRVYNPDFEQHGWQCPYTVVEIVSDDMPFLVDSVGIELARRGYGTQLTIHPVIAVLRDADGTLVSVLEFGAPDAGASHDSIIHVELDREPNDNLLLELREHIERVLGEVRAAVEDWQPMRSVTESLTEELRTRHGPIPEYELDEARSFLRWLVDDHFVFLGYREYRLVTSEPPARIEAVAETGLGILRGAPLTPITELTDKALALALAPSPLVLTKANSVSTVHRRVYLDYVGVKLFGPDRAVIGERRFLGLYTNTAYRDSPDQIPLIRGKVKHVLDRAGFPPGSHDAKALMLICDAYPRDSLFQIEPDELYRIAAGLAGLGERQRVRMFAHSDALGRFVSCLVCLPRDRFNTVNRLRVAEILQRAFGGTQIDWTVQLTESLLARVYYIVHCPNGILEPYDETEIEREIVIATRSWKDDLRDALIEEHGEEIGRQQLWRYEDAFPAAYREDWPARSAVADIARIQELAQRSDPILTLYRPLEAPEGSIRCKLFSRVGISLSDVLPTFEHLGARVIDERPYEIEPADGETAWLYDFGMRCEAGDAVSLRERFQDAFLGVWRGELEDDSLNRLVLLAGLTGRQITILRALAKYLRQAGIPFSDRYMERTVIDHPEIAALLVRLFNARLDPDARDEQLATELGAELREMIDAVASLDEDRILRNFMSVVQAILRTNYFTTDESGASKSYLSVKLDPGLIPVLPLPRPRFEIFVYSPRVEGVHLRGGKVARGGLRWSDRREDFRTEVLGLMKAQMVKNALIVPVGSKGGFVVKRPPSTGGRDALLAEGIACYRIFLAGLLDLTDNIVGDQVVAPARLVRYDGDDPYLVVAADKGTATFSDIANQVSADYGFWLSDAFASGGSQGYDHKIIGITARGAWESVKRHFRELGTDIQTTDFTVVGIGDMAGDVFGNGMLLSAHVRLLAAFNHLHVFLDPDPDAALSFQERKRLFELPRSSWSDYDASLISPGGGVYERTAKSIPISDQVKQALAIDAHELAPADLIRAILQAPVDLLWSGGIGTFVKESAESHSDAGDKANDAIRVDAAHLRCKVVGEGGNLGFTQRGRIEYALAGGQINTDAIDNVAGVNCSDHEVNIKILLDSLLADGDITPKQRNELLMQMTDAVAERVIYGSYTQTQAISLALRQADGMLDVHARLICELERVAGLNRRLELLPSESVINQRKIAKRGLTAPELAVVMAYCKIHLYTELLDSDLPEDPHLSHDLERYFPAPLPERYAERMRSHRLRREIVATLVANQIVDRAGTTFAFRLCEETGAPPSILARAYAAARAVYEVPSFWTAVESLDVQVDAGTLLSMLIEARRLVERATRWLVRASVASIDIARTVGRYAAGAQMLWTALPEMLDPTDRAAYDALFGELLAGGVGRDLARRVASMPSMCQVFDIVEVSNTTQRDPEVVVQTFFGLGSRLRLNWLRERIIALPRDNRWRARARDALYDDLNSLVRVLAQEVLEAGGPSADSERAIGAWEAGHGAAVQRCLGMLADIDSSGIHDTTTLPVALREVRNLVRAASGVSVSPAPPAGGAP